METLLTAISAMTVVLAIGGCLWLLRAPSIYLLALHVLSRVVLDSASELTYQPVLAGLSLMQLYSVCFIGASAAHLYLRHRLQMHRYTLPLAAIVSAAALSAYLSSSWMELIVLILRWAYLWILIALTLSALADGHGRKLMGAVAVAGLYTFLNQLYSIVTNQPKWGADQWSYVGTYAHESDISFLLTMLVVPGVYFVSRPENAMSKVFGLGCLVTAHIGLAYAAYRSLWVATAAYWGFYIWTRYLHGSISKRAFWVIASLGTVMISTVVLGPSIVEKMEDLAVFAANPSQYLDFSGDAKRMYLLSGRVDLINSYMGTYLNSGVHVWAAGIGPAQGKAAMGLYAHNEYLSALVETGIFGFTALLWFLFQIASDAFALAKSTDPFAQATAPFLLVVLVSALGTMPFQDMRALMALGLVLGYLGHCRSKAKSQPLSAVSRSELEPQVLKLNSVQVLR
jgi:hypothetical protein